MTDSVKIYVYGSCHFSGTSESDDTIGNGGYGVVISLNEQTGEQIAGGFSNTTNARMDIMGITEGLKRIKRPSKIIVYSNNGYVIDTLSKGWLEKWKKTGFKKKKHADLWKELDKVLQATSHSISYKRGHEAKYDKNFQLAEELGKKMSGKANLPIDIMTENTASIFEAEVPKTEIAQLQDSVPILDSISVDASCIGNPGITEYRGVNTKTKEIIFQRKYAEATNNIGEFLAIVHALALSKRDNRDFKIIYSDSQTAMSWVKKKKCRTSFQRTDKNSQLFDDIQRAIEWLEKNTYTAKVLKWHTATWGEIPADYGRKTS